MSIHFTMPDRAHSLLPARPHRTPPREPPSGLFGSNQPRNPSEQLTSAAAVDDRIPHPVHTVRAGDTGERALAAIRAVAEASGSEYDRFLAECVGVMLSSTGRITEERAKGASAMGRMSSEYRRSLEEWARPRVDAAARRAREEGRREGRREARREGRYEAQVEMLRQQVEHKFGAEAAESLDSLLNGPDDQARVAVVSRAIVECDSAAAFLERARSP